MKANLIAPEGTKIVSPGFAMSEPMTCKNRFGKMVAIRTCYEFIAGRWEGFISIQNFRAADWTASV